MEAALFNSSPYQSAHDESHSRGHKRIKISSDARDFNGTTSSNMYRSTKENARDVIDYSHSFAISDLVEELDTGKYGSVTKDIEALLRRKAQAVGHLFSVYPTLVDSLLAKESGPAKSTSRVHDNMIDLEDECFDKFAAKGEQGIIVIDSDEEEKKEHRLPHLFQEIFLPRPIGPLPLLDEEVIHRGDSKHQRQMGRVNNRGEGKHQREKAGSHSEVNSKKDEGVYVGVEGDEFENQNEDDGLGDIWNEMSLALETSKDITECPSLAEQTKEEEDDCDHSFVLKDDLGYVCRVCGVIQRAIDTIIEVQFNKANKSTRTYMYESRKVKYSDRSEISGYEQPEEDWRVTDISAHPRHLNQMKPHQVEGFNFLCSNLVTDNPGGCILFHAPGSGKTFMIISFMQSFLAKYPQARPLVVLPKGIVETWKKEFERWQVEDIPLLDFYSVKADSRAQQLEILKKWMECKSILFLGYTQFSTIICDNDVNNKDVASCQDILLKRPSLLILDEGHTPRNDETNVLQSLSKIQTPRKVVLTGTLYQNHVKEVFNILNLVRPKFLKLDTSRVLVRRIMAQVKISEKRKHLKADSEAAFYELVEHTIQKDDDFNLKVAVIRDLREMTRKVLHYFKGDFLDELPGLVDFTVVMNLSRKQKLEVQTLNKFTWKFKKNSVGSAIYLHPKLKAFSFSEQKNTVTDHMMDELLEKLDVRDGVKAKFFLNLLNLCESAGEKLLVFSQYLTPLKFLERLATKLKGYVAGSETFFISDDSSPEQRECSMERFNNSVDAKVFFGSIKACGEGISLVGASRIIILDVPANPSVTRQAIGRAFRPGQKKKVYVYRLIAADSLEEEDHNSSFQKEAIAKMWFEWNEYCGYKNFEVQAVDITECGDIFLESPLIKGDIKSLHRR